MNGVNRLHRLRAIALRILLVGAAVTTALYIHHQVQNAESHRIDRPQRVTLVDEVLPPPPKEEIAPPEPDVLEEDVTFEPLDEPPMPQDDAGAIDDALGLDAAGQGGMDSFGLLAKRGGRDIMAMIGKEMPRGTEYRYYGQQVARFLESLFYEYDDLRRREYKVELKLWISNGGRIERCELTGTTGYALIDKRIVEVLRDAAMDEPPPTSMPRPINIRVTSRIAR